MIEPEIAFYDLKMDMDVIEDFIRYVVTTVLDKCKSELQVLERDTTYLQKVSEPFIRMRYEDAVSVIKGEKEVDGKTSLQMLEEEQSGLQSAISNLQKEIGPLKVRIDIYACKTRDRSKAIVTAP